MARSGYIHVSCLNIAALDNNLGLINNIMPRKMFFGAPTNAGTATLLRLPLYKRGTPPAGLIDVELWSVKSGGDPFTDVLSGPNWLQIGSAAIDPSSVTGVDSSQNATWIDIPLAAPVYLDSAPDDLPLTDGQEAGLVYALRLNHTSASSTSTAADALALAYTSSISTTFGFQARSGEAQYNGAFDWQDIQFGIYGLITPSSKYRDAPLMVFDPGSTRPGIQYFSSAINRQATGFTAVGSNITRAKISTVIQGLKQMQTFAGIWTTNTTSDQPNVCVGTSALVVINSGTVAASYFSTIDLQGKEYGFMFVFSGGISVNSGDKYWISMDVLSYEFSSGSEFIGLRRALNGKRHAYWNPNSVGEIFNVESSTLYAEVWYRDNQTEIDWSVDRGLGAYFTPLSAQLTNPGFETGSSDGWTAFLGAIIVSSGGAGVLARSGTYQAYGGDTTKTWQGQWITIPSSIQDLASMGALRGFLNAYQHGSIADADNGQIIVDLYDASSAFIARSMTEFENTSGWHAVSLDLFIPKTATRMFLGLKAQRVTGTAINQNWDDFNFVFDQSSYYTDNLWSENGNNASSMTVVSGPAISVVSSHLWGGENPIMYSTNGTSTWYNWQKDLPIPSSYWASINSQLAYANLFATQAGLTTGAGARGRAILNFISSGGTVVGSISVPTSRTSVNTYYVPRSMQTIIPQSSAIIRVILEGERISGTNIDVYWSKANVSISAPNSLPKQGYIYPILTTGGFTRSYPQTSRKYPELIDRKYPL